MIVYKARFITAASVIVELHTEFRAAIVAEPEHLVK